MCVFFGVFFIVLVGFFGFLFVVVVFGLLLCVWGFLIVFGFCCCCFCCFGVGFLCQFLLLFFFFFLWRFKGIIISNSICFQK